MSTPHLTTNTGPRKGFGRLKDIPPDILARLNRGEEQTATLTEATAMDFRILARTVFQKDARWDETALAPEVPLLRRMENAGHILDSTPDPDRAFAHAKEHPADTVRGWAAWALRARWKKGETLETLLSAMRPLANDPHFGVREWAWIALRPAVLKTLPRALDFLVPWTTEPSENLRRFAVEILRPRGVWCSHCPDFRADPAPGLRLLEPLRADPSLYVRTSVANWLNDAAKSAPDWVDSLCTKWEKDSPTPQTRHIVRRARRSLPAKPGENRR